MIEGGRGPLVRLVFGHFLAAAAEWAIYIGAFVYAFGRGGAAATGVASIVLLASTVISSPIGGHISARLQPNLARLLSLWGQAVGFFIAGIAALSSGSLVIVLVGSALSLSLFRVLRPAQAVLVPLLCAHPRQLTTANLWIGHADSAAALVGPLTATGLMAISGPGAVFSGFGVALAIAGGLQMVDRSKGRSIRMASLDAPATADVIRGPFRQLRARGGLLSLVGLIMFQYGLVGALDILFVVITLDTLGLDATASSLLTSAFGLGAVGAVGLSALAHRSNQLARALSVSLVLCGLIVVAMAVSLTGSTASLSPLLIGLPFLGAARFVIVVVARALLQRSADDDTVGGVFALQELASGIGILSGSVLAQLTLAISGPALTLSVLAAAYAATAAATWRPLRRAEASATVPLVEMGILRNVPAFAPLPPMTLETVARRAELVDVEASVEVVTQGDPGHQFYVVMDGSCDVVMDGSFVRRANRGDSFGEVALLANIERTATVVATESTTLLAVSREPFLEALSSHPGAGVSMWHGVSEMDFGDRVVEIPDLDNLTSNTGT